MALFRRVVSAVLATGLTAGCTTPIFYWDVPVRGPVPSSQAAVPQDVPPEVMCAVVRQGAINQRNKDVALGVLFGLLGGAAASSGTALAAQTTGHTSEWTAGWASLAGAGLVATAAGIYFIVKSGNDRQEYWLTNGAIAKIHADYAQYPNLTSGQISDAVNAWEDAAAKCAAHPCAAEDKARDALIALIHQQDVLQTTPAGHAYLVDKAEEYKIYAAKKTAEAAAWTSIVTERDTNVSIALTKYQTAVTAAQKADDAKPKVDDDVRVAHGALDQAAKELKTAQDMAEAARTTMKDAAIDAAAETAIAGDKMNAMMGLQAAWTDCATALTAIGASDAAAAAAFASALSGAGGSKGGGSSAASAGGAAASGAAGH